MRALILMAALAVASPALGQSFSCRIGTQPACLDYGDKICSSSVKCVDSNAACFDSYQCGHLRMPIDDLIKSNQKRQYPAVIIKESDPAGALAGSVVIFTGELSMSRTEAADLAARVGMTVKAAVTRKTTHLVVVDQDLTVLAGHTKSSKHRKAEEMQSAGHPVRIMGEPNSRRS